MMITLGLQSIVFITILESILLVTNRQHVIEGVDFMLQPGSCAWRAVHMELAVPYVFVRYGKLEQGFWLSQSSILWRPEDVLTFFQDVKSDQTRRIIEVALLLDSRGDCKKGWRWERLAQVWSGTYSGGEAYSPVYVSDAGDHIDGLGRTINAKTIELQERLYYVSGESHEK
jgi:hypothetical protein